MPYCFSALRPEPDSKEKAKWSCSLSAFNYVGELYNRVLIEPVDFPVGRGPIQAKEDSVDVHGEITGGT